MAAIKQSNRPVRSQSKSIPFFSTHNLSNNYQFLSRRRRCRAGDITPIDSCYPSPCGLYSQCRVINEHTVCSCLPGYVGSAPNCRPECVVSSECAQNRACINQKCADPCISMCGLNARCQVVNHNPICSCSVGYTGDPFIRCIAESKCMCCIASISYP